MKGVQPEVSSLGDKEEMNSITRRETPAKVPVLWGNSSSACPGFPMVMGLLRSQHETNLSSFIHYLAVCV